MIVLSKDEQEGVQAIVYLQACVGIVEPVDLALANWRKFNAHQREITLSTYRLMIKNGKAN